MPYIKQEDRQRFEAALQAFPPPATAGELNYVITRLILAYAGPKPNYARLNEVVGVMEAAKLEFYRRAAAPYEDDKVRENGDVYPFVPLADDAALGVGPLTHRGVPLQHDPAQVNIPVGEPNRALCSWCGTMPAYKDGECDQCRHMAELR